jgi:hypothetical protein
MENVVDINERIALNKIRESSLEELLEMAETYLSSPAS